MKYEKSSVEACAPSASAMKGRKDQSLSTAGSTPGGRPNQDSISGPLYGTDQLYELTTDNMKTESELSSSDAGAREGFNFE